MTARVPMSFHPELDGKSLRSERVLYVHLDDDGEVTSAEIPGALFTVGQLRALAELSGWTWERFLEEVGFKAEDQAASWDAVTVEARAL
jgi:hypothetical protein